VINKLKRKSFKVQAKWLVCKDICIPGEKTISVNFDGLEFHSKDSDKTHFSVKEMSENFSSLPIERKSLKGLELTLGRDQNNELSLVYRPAHSQGLSGLLKDKNLLIPYPHSPFDFHREKLFQDKNGRLFGKIKVDWDGEYQDPPIKLPEDGVFNPPYRLRFLYLNPDTKAYEIIEHSFETIKAYNFKNLQAYTPSDSRKVVRKPVKSSPQAPFVYFFLLAALGGLLLNLMPCVLPVISLKIFYLIKHRKESKAQVLKHNFFYSLGILVTFFILALVIIGLKSTGELIGWGFQLQSPKFLAGIIIILFVLSLNLFGLFHFITPGGKFLGNIQTKNNYFGDFLSGVLTTILATPCSAPFLGTALTFAFTTTTLNIFGIFSGVALGLAFPFLIAGFFPKVISFLPKPGLWMEKFKKLLGLSLILTIVWLVDVLVTINPGQQFIILLGTTLSLTFFAFYIRRHITKNKYVLTLLFLLPLGVMGKILTFKPAIISYKPDSMMSSELPWEPWSPKRMEQLKNTGQQVFIDFTAKWCLTCKVNEKLVLNTKDFKNLVREKNLSLLLADWTKRDETITNWLFSHGKVGVPAYFIITKDGQLKDLGETISIDEIKSHLR
jgi:thiol:disulfide interchange protein DsbD